VASRLQAIWYRPSAPPVMLRPLSLLFGLGVRARRAAYAGGLLRSQRLAQPVVVVGNLSVGGSGKTPLVIWLTAKLRAAGFAPGVVLRGYRGSAARSATPLRVQADSDPAVVGDEALLLRERTGGPVAVCSDRVSAARLLAAEGANLIVSDDGLQHFSLARDFEIAVVDGERGLGNGYLLPAGPLREPPRRLESVDAVVVNGEGPYWASLNKPLTMRLAGDRLMALDGRAASIALSSLAGHRVHALAGIGYPQRFFAQLRAAGIEPIEHPFPDHHRFRRDEMLFDDGLPVLMTEKDAVKCRGLGGPDHWYLPVTASFAETDAATLLGRLRRALEQQKIRIAGE
jgi:tetraacyldisaccharide 4'-kinase